MLMAAVSLQVGTFRDDDRPAAQHVSWGSMPLNEVRKLVLLVSASDKGLFTTG